MSDYEKYRNEAVTLMECLHQIPEGISSGMIRSVVDAIIDAAVAKMEADRYSSCRCPFLRTRPGLEFAPCR